MIIRPARLDDLAVIKNCARDAYVLYVERIGREPAPMVADFKSQIEQDIVYVSADEQNNIQGFIVFYAKNDHVQLENVAVFGQYQGKGIGKKLIAYCEEFARQNGYSNVQLYTNEKMTENLDVYPRLGYKETGRWTEDGFNRVFFKKEI